MQRKENIIRSLTNRQICCDNVELFSQLPDETIDLILTDPPYKNYQSNRPVARPRVKAMNVTQFDLEFFAGESWRVLKPGGHLYCFCDHITYPDIRSGLVESGLTYKNCLVWIKNNHGSGDLKGNWAPQHEFIIFATKGRGKPLRGLRKPNVLLKRNVGGGWEFYKKVSNYRFNHGTAKPVDLLRSLIQSSSDAGDIVLDPYGGSGSTAEACIREKRRFIQCEIDPEHSKQAQDRIDFIKTQIKQSTIKHKRVTA